MLLRTGNIPQTEEVYLLSQRSGVFWDDSRKEGVQMDLVKLKAIWEWSPPNPLKLYSHSSASATSIKSSSPPSLTSLTPSWTLSNNQPCGLGVLTRRKHFRTSRLYLSNNQSWSSLIPPNPSHSWQIPPWQHQELCLCSKYNANGDMQPCAYLFQTFSYIKNNHDIFDQELLAIICGLEEWR